MTSGSAVAQGYQNSYHSTDWLWFRITVL